MLRARAHGTMPVLALILLSLGSDTSAAPALPGEIPGFDAIAREIRSPISLKMQDLRSSATLQETSPGTIEILDAQGRRPIGELRISQSLNSTKTSRVEEVVYTLSDGKTAFRERITTEGVDLELTPAAERIFFSDFDPYSLRGSETRKDAVLYLGAVPIHRFVSTRASSTAPWREVRTHDIYFNDTLQLSIRDATSSDDTRRVVEYDTRERAVVLAIPGSRSRSCCNPTGTYRVEASRPSGYLVDGYRFHARGDEKYSLDAFIAVFSEDLYGPLFSGPNASRAYIKRFVERVFPRTERPVNAAATSPFLIELMNLRIQVEQAQNNPSLLTQISQKLTLIINAVRAGTLQVTDNRPRP